MFFPRPRDFFIRVFEKLNIFVIFYFGHYLRLFTMNETSLYVLIETILIILWRIIILLKLWNPWYILDTSHV